MDGSKFTGMNFLVKPTTKKWKMWGDRSKFAGMNSLVKPTTKKVEKYREIGQNLPEWITYLSQLQINGKI